MAQIQVAEHFAPGSKVTVIPKTTDFAPPQARGGVKNVSVANDGTVKLDGLVEHGQYWLHDGTKAVSYNVPGSSESLADEMEKRNQAMADIRSKHPNLAEPLHQPDDIQADDGIAKHNFERSSEPVPTPAAKQADMPKGTPQRTSTPLGTAYPVDPGEIQPQPGKEHVKAGTPQRDGAEVGYATPVDPGEVQPAVKYEQEKGPQRVGADTGTAYPMPKGTVKEQELVKSSSESKAKGATVPVAGTDKVPAKKAKGAPKATKAQAAKVKDPVKPEAKKAVKEGNG